MVNLTIDLLWGSKGDRKATVEGLHSLSFLHATMLFFEGGAGFWGGAQTH